MCFACRTFHKSTKEKWARPPNPKDWFTICQMEPLFNRLVHCSHLFVCYKADVPHCSKLPLFVQIFKTFKVIDFLTPIFRKIWNSIFRTKLFIFSMIQPFRQCVHCVIRNSTFSSHPVENIIIIRNTSSPSQISLLFWSEEYVVIWLQCQNPVPRNFFQGFWQENMYKLDMERRGLNRQSVPESMIRYVKKCQMNL